MLFVDSLPHHLALFSLWDAAKMDVSKDAQDANAMVKEREAELLDGQRVGEPGTVWMNLMD